MSGIWVTPYGVNILLPISADIMEVYMSKLILPFLNTQQNGYFTGWKVGFPRLNQGDSGLILFTSI